MGKGKMDEAAAARIKKARGEKDEFARRAEMAAKANKDTSSGSGQQQGQQTGGTSASK